MSDKFESTIDVYNAISAAVQAATVHSSVPLYPYPTVFSRGVAAEARGHGSFRVVPLLPTSIKRQGPCMEYLRVWQVTVSFALNVAQDQRQVVAPAFDTEDLLVTELANLEFVTSPPAGSYQEADNGRFVELVLNLETNYRRPAGR